MKELPVISTPTQDPTTQHSALSTQHSQSRREFLTATGFTFAGVFLAGCQRAPEEKAVPPLVQPEGMAPGVARYYASTCGACQAGCGLLVKTMDGRPIKLEGDPEHPLSKGGLCAAGQASLLGLYDKLRVHQPLIEGKEVTWEESDRTIRGQLETIRRENKGAVCILSGTITSPTTRELVKGFLGSFGKAARHVVYDPVSCSGILDAHQLTHGVRVLPHFQFDKAEVIVSFDADFLGTWIAPVEFTKGYRARRQLTDNPPRSSFHVQVESLLSLTGSKADERLVVTPDEIGPVMTHLAAVLAKKAGVKLEDGGWKIEDGKAGAGDGSSSILHPPSSILIEQLADRLWQARGRSLVVCGTQDVPIQTVCNFINHLLENYGKTLDIERPSQQRQGNDKELQQLLGDIRDRKVAALVILDSNPVYDLPDGTALADAFKQIPLVVCCTERLDETASVARYVCPHPHYLETWSDTEVVSGIVAISQPTIPPLRDSNTRPFAESLVAWREPPSLPVYDLIRNHWEAHIFPRRLVKERNFQAFWDNAVHDGHVEINPLPVRAKTFDEAAVKPVLPLIPPGSGNNGSSNPTLVLYRKVGMLDGSHAYNPWLQELPDPISKVTWDNYACLSPAAASKLGLSEGDVVSLEVPADANASKPDTLELPVFIQPGQHDQVVAVALGYGSSASKRFADIGPKWLEARPTLGENGLVGKNAAPLLAWSNGTLRYTRANVKVTRTGKKHTLASTQTHHSVTVPAHLAPPGQERRPIIQEINLADLQKSHEPDRPESQHEGHDELWPADHPYKDLRWGMVIDLNACTGCSACVIACQAENNVPVVGKDEVTRRREMHWLRIDRYYSEPEHPAANKTASQGAQAPTSGDIDVAYQPMLCQHCEKAPCETVCPVLATVHSSEGINEQAYNRCVGTRYCANNCPYKVRRFNWFAYAHEDKLQNLSLNPEVTVRSRGVMEKCSFCIQRIQEVRIEARHRGEQPADGAIQTACQQSCPAQAISFGNVNDPKSKVVQLRKDSRYYQVLGELNIGPAVGYLKIVRNR